MRTALIALSIAVLTLFPSNAASALGSPACDTLAPGLSQLQQSLGAAIGSPVSCPMTDERGNVIQLTSTGLAVVDHDGTVLFASGDHHWALDADGLHSWIGNWHNGLYPPQAVQPDETDSTPAEGTPASVEPMVVEHVAADAGNAVVVQDPEGSMFTVETDSGCPDVGAAPGDHVFVRYDGPRTDLILLQQHATCLVVAMNSAAGD